MENEFAPYQPSLDMKELGFDEPCFGFYKLGDNDIYYDSIIQSKNTKFRNNTELNFYGDLIQKISAPLYQQAFRWFREEYNFDSYIRPNIVIDIPKTYQFNINDNTYDTWYETSEEAELECLKKLIEIVKNK
jgi:hypothetical protein